MNDAPLIQLPSRLSDSERNELTSHLLKNTLNINNIPQDAVYEQPFHANEYEMIPQGNREYTNIQNKFDCKNQAPPLPKRPTNLPKLVRPNVNPNSTNTATCSNPKTWVKKIYSSLMRKAAVAIYTHAANI